MTWHNRHPIRLANGELAAHQDGHCVALTQTDWRVKIHALGAAPMWCGIAQLDDGSWLACPGLWSHSPRYTSAEAAIRASAAQVIRNARRLSGAPAWCVVRIEKAAAREVIHRVYEALQQPMPAGVPEPATPPERTARPGQIDLFQEAG